MHAPRRRSLPLAALAFTLLSVAAVFVVRQALACPVEIQPQPLRTLYKHSTRIVVARVGETQLVEREESYSSVRTALHVERDVKGKGDAVVFVHHETWDEHGVEKPGTFKQGERLLVFLDARDEGEGYEVYDTNYGVKKLSDDDLKVYLARIGELGQIEGQQPPDKAALVEWLVRCAEEPATRWEGAYELMLSAEALAREGDESGTPADADADTSAGTPAETVSAELSVNKHNATVEEYEAAVARARAAAGDASAAAPASDSVQTADAEPDSGPNEVEVVAEGEPVYVGRATPPDPSLAAALGEGQKRRLADALFAEEKIGDGEDTLLQVVKGFGDARLVPFLVAQLRRVEDDPPPEAEAWLSALAQALKNEEADTLVAKYAQDVTYFEEEPGVELVMVVEETADEEKSAAEVEAAQKELEAREAAGNERARKKRSAMLKDLLARVEGILASPDVARRQTPN